MVAFFFSCGKGYHKESLLEKNRGRAFETQVYLQTANPDANKQAQPVMVMDGSSSDNVMKEYRKSFSTENAKETVNILKLK
jgi:hypothetical protein